jgi:hypothetical protein
MHPFEVRGYVVRIVPTWIGELLTETDGVVLVAASAGIAIMIVGAIDKSIAAHKNRNR